MNQPRLDNRRRDLALIHVAKKELALSDDDYRALLWTVARARSSADLDAHDRRQVIDHMKARGFRPRRTGRPRASWDRMGQIKKIRALLADAGRADAYADGMARRMFKVERYEWLQPDQLGKVIAALTYDQKRRNCKGKPQ